MPGWEVGVVRSSRVFIPLRDGRRWWQPETEETFPRAQSKPFSSSADHGLKFMPPPEQDWTDEGLKMLPGKRTSLGLKPVSYPPKAACLAAASDDEGNVWNSPWSKTWEKRQS